MAAVTKGAGKSSASLKTQQWSVVIMSTLAFTVCFAVWMMFAVIGIPIKKMLDLNATQFGVADRDAGADRLADPRAARHVDRQVRRPDRLLRADDRHRHPDLADRLCHRVLALPRARPVRRPGRRLIFGRHAVRRPLVRQEAPGLCDGHLRRRQLRRRGHQVRRPGDRRRLRLGLGAAGLRRGDADHRHCLLVLHLQRSRRT